MYCKYCGKEIADGSAFCKYCGSNLMSGREATEDNDYHEVTGEQDIYQIERQTISERRSINKLAIAIPMVVVILGICFALIFVNSDKLGLTNKIEQDVTKEEYESKEVLTPKPLTTPKPVKESQMMKEEDKIDENKGDGEVVPETHYIEEKLRIGSASATSYLGTTAKDGQTYEPAHIIDGDYATAWIEGKDDLGIGESITLDFGKTERITRMLLYNGFLNSKYRYEINGKVTKALIEFDSGTSETVDVNVMETSGYQIPFVEAEMNPTELVFSTPITASNVKITILDAVPGTKYTDVCISEVELFYEEDINEAKKADIPIEDDVIKAYSTYYDDNFHPTEYGTYSVALVYLDEDEVPELFVRENFDMGEITILQYEDGKVYDIGTFESIDYIPKKNDLVYGWSDGENSEDIQYQLINHKFVPVGGVSASYGDDGSIQYYVVDKNGIRTETTEEEYNDHFKILRKYGNYLSSNDDSFYLSVEEATNNQ